MAGQVLEPVIKNNYIDLSLSSVEASFALLASFVLLDSIRSEEAGERGKESVQGTLSHVHLPFSPIIGVVNGPFKNMGLAKCL